MVRLLVKILIAPLAFTNALELTKTMRATTFVGAPGQEQSNHGDHHGDHSVSPSTLAAFQRMGQLKQEIENYEVSVDVEWDALKQELPHSAALRRLDQLRHEVEKNEELMDPEWEALRQELHSPPDRRGAGLILMSLYSAFRKFVTAVHRPNHGDRSVSPSTLAALQRMDQLKREWEKVEKKADVEWDVLKQALPHLAAIRRLDQLRREAEKNEKLMGPEWDALRQELRAPQD